MFLFVTVIVLWLVSVVWLWVFVWRRTRHWQPSIARAAARSFVVSAALSVSFAGGGIAVFPAPASLAFISGVVEFLFYPPERGPQRSQLMAQVQLASLLFGIFWLIAFFVTLWHQHSVARSKARFIHATSHVLRNPRNA